MTQDEATNLGEQIAAKISEALPDLILPNGKHLTIAEGISKLTGLPNEFVPLLVSQIADKNGIEVEDFGKELSTFAFDLVMTAAAIGYAKGKRVALATDSAKAASESVS